MKAIYFQFNAAQNKSITKENGWIKSSVEKSVAAILAKIIPTANPDFDDKIEAVKHWLVECELKSGLPMREIGLDSVGQVIIRIPFKENYGYWTDNTLLIDDFKRLLAATEISKDRFEEKWEMFDRL
ncbi:MAG: hypothetical protein ACRCYO_16375 [Bacteroidia bacterium]